MKCWGDGRGPDAVGRHVCLPEGTSWAAEVPSQGLLPQIISAPAHGQTGPRTGMAKKPVTEEVLDNPVLVPVPVPVPHPWCPGPGPRSFMLLWGTAPRQESTSSAANLRLPSVCFWPIPCEDMCLWPIGRFHAAWLPLRAGGRLRGAEEGLAPFWCSRVGVGRACQGLLFSSLVCPPCFSQCWRRCKWSPAVQIGS